MSLTFLVSVSISHTESDGDSVTVISLLWISQSFFISLWFTGCELSILLVMLIVSRPPAEWDSFPVGRLWSCLPKQLSMCVALSVCVYSAQLQCVIEAIALLYMCTYDYVCWNLSVWMFMCHPPWGGCFPDASEIYSDEVKQSLVSSLCCLILFSFLSSQLSSSYKSKNLWGQEDSLQMTRQNKILTSVRIFKLTNTFQSS